MVLALIVGVPVYAINKAGQAVGWPVLLGGIVAAMVAIGMYRAARARAAEAERLKRIEERRNALMQKYGDQQLVEMIMGRQYWQGQTAEQLRDSLGDPIDMDQRVLKRKTREVWKYNQLGVRQFGLRITLENGTVVGWDDKT